MIVVDVEQKCCGSVWPIIVVDVEQKCCGTEVCGRSLLLMLNRNATEVCGR